MKTVTHEGKQYQIGAVYEFSDDGEYWITGVLEAVEVNSRPFIFELEGCGYKHIRECQSPIGTITDAPLELEDGEWYMCEGPRGSSVHQCHGGRISGTALEAVPLYKMVKA